MAMAMHAMQSSAASSTSRQATSTTAPVLEFVCLFTHDLRRKQKRWQDGRLKFHTFNKRVMVYDERGNFIGDTHWREDFPLSDGEELQLERGGTIVQVAECTGRQDQDLSELVDKRAQEKAERQAAALARRHPTLEPTTPQAASAVAPHLQLNHRPLHHLIGTPTGHHGPALIPSESPYEQRQRQQGESPAHGEASHPAKRRKRDLSPPSKSGYAQSLFGATLTLSGRPMSSAPLRHRPAKTVPAQGDPCPSSSGRSNGGGGMEPEPPIPAMSRNMPIGGRILTHVPRESPASPPQSRTGRTISPILLDDSPEQHRLSSAACNRISRPLDSAGDGHISNKKQRNPLRPVPPNENQVATNSANRLRNENFAKRPLLSNEAVGNVSRGRQELQQYPETEEMQTHQDARTRMVSHNDQHPNPARPTPRPKPSKYFGASEAASEDPEAPPPEEMPRTELRIRPRKKPGLLMLSEKPSVPTKAKTKSKLKSKSNFASTITGSTDMLELDTLRDMDNDMPLSNGLTSRDYEFQNLNEDIGVGSRSRQRQSVNRNSVLAEQAVPMDDHVVSPEDARDSLARNPLSKKSKSREQVPKSRGIAMAARVSSPLDGANASAISSDDQSKVHRVVSEKTSRRKCGRAMTEDSGDDQQEPPSVQEPRNRRSRRVAKNRTVTIDASFEEPRTDRQETPDEDSDSPEEAPTPRLAKIKNGIRSRELIGFHFQDSDEDHCDESNPPADQEPALSQPPRISRAQSQTNTRTPELHSPKAAESLNQSVVPHDTPNEISLDEPARQNSRQSRSSRKEQASVPEVATVDSSQGDRGGHDETSEHLTKAALHPQTSAEQIISTGSGPTEVHSPSAPNRLQQQDSVGQNEPGPSESAQQATLGEADATRTRTATTRRIVNPATRGRKAAKPSDAAGQLPQCPVPLEARSIGLPGLNAKKQGGGAGKPDKEAATPLPGFAKANGGPWSREAFDLFEFKRPT